MDVSCYLNQVIPLNWWKTELQDHYHDHAGPALIVLATSMIVSYVWGKYTAVGFLVIAFVTYPLSHKQIKYFMFLEAYGTGQAVACVAIPILCSKIPGLSAWSLPFHVALAYSILTREWRLCQASCNTFEEILRLQQLNQQLSKQASSLEGNSLTLKAALDQLIVHVEKKKDLTRQVDDLTRSGDQIAIRSGVDFNTLNERLEQLSKICLIVAQTNGLREQIGKVDKNQRRLQELVDSCEDKNKELTELIQKIEKLKEDLSQILNKAIAGEMQTQQGLKMVQTWIAAIINREV